MTGIEYCDRYVPQEMTPQDIDKCDDLALKHAGLSSTKEFLKRRVLKDLRSVYYTSPDGNSLIVCRDGSVLMADECVSFGYHRMAFEEGLRSSPELLSAFQR